MRARTRTLTCSAQHILRAWELQVFGDSVPVEGHLHTVRYAVLPKNCWLAPLQIPGAGAPCQPAQKSASTKDAAGLGWQESQHTHVGEHTQEVHEKGVKGEHSRALPKLLSALELTAYVAALDMHTDSSQTQGDDPGLERPGVAGQRKRAVERLVRARRLLVSVLVTGRVGTCGVVADTSTASAAAAVELARGFVLESTWAGHVSVPVGSSPRPVY